MMMNTSTPTIDVDAENSSRNQRVCIGKKRMHAVALLSDINNAIFSIVR
jgi:hypothetical protein